MLRALAISGKKALLYSSPHIQSVDRIGLCCLMLFNNEEKASISQFLPRKTVQL